MSINKKEPKIIYIDLNINTKKKNEDEDTAIKNKINELVGKNASPPQGDMGIFLALLQFLLQQLDKCQKEPISNTNEIIINEFTQVAVNTNPYYPNIKYGFKLDSNKVIPFTNIFVKL